MKRPLLCFVVLICLAQPAWGARAKIETLSADPYLSALVLDADSGDVIFEENSTASAYPASVLKLMVLLLVLERVEQGTLQLDDMVQVTREAARMGGSQVYLDPKERFSVDDLLHALIIQSANDAAVALAIHVAGSKEGFVALMNERAGELGMTDTEFHSVHGLPPSEGQQPDRTTARDLALLGRELARRPATFTYTGTRERGFRDGEFIMRTHNHLLKNYEGCDGFKTGYFRAAGFSIVATAKRSGVRIIAIVLGSQNREVRDAAAAELLSTGFAAVPPRPEQEATAAASPEPAAVAQAETAAVPAPEKQSPQGDVRTFVSGRDVVVFLGGLAAGLLLCLLVGLYRSGSRPRRRRRLM